LASSVSYFIGQKSKPKFKTVQVLLDSGANVNAKDKEGHTPVLEVLRTFAYDDKNLAVAQLLVERGADVNTRSNHNYEETLLHVASKQVHLKFVQVLLDCGANVNAVDNEGRTPLYQVLEPPGFHWHLSGLWFDETDYPHDYLDNRNFDIAQLLIEQGADVNTPNSGSGHQSPLHLASHAVSLELAWILVQNGADLHAKNGKGKTSFQLVQERMRNKVEQSSSEYSIRQAWRARGVALMGLLYDEYH